MSNQYPHDPNLPPHLRDDNVISNSPLNPNHPSSAAYVPKKSHKVRTALIIVGVLFVGLVGCTAIVGGVLDNAADAPVGVTAPSTAPVEEPTASVTTEPAPTKAAPVKTTATKPAMTVSQEQAVGQAESYLDGQSFSKKGLIEQLKFEGFSLADATFAVGHIKVNWNDQAAATAKNYLRGQHFSRSGLIAQLEFEGFTRRQAVYGVSKAGL